MDQLRRQNLKITRPANVTVYSDNDVIADVTDALNKFILSENEAGKNINIINFKAFTNDTGLAGKTIDVHFYNDVIVPISDNAAMVISTANELKREGILSLTFGTGVKASVAQDLFTNLVIIPIPFHIPVQVSLPAGYTPSANSTYIILKIGYILSN